MDWSPVDFARPSRLRAATSVVLALLAAAGTAWSVVLWIGIDSAGTRMAAQVIDRRLATQRAGRMAPPADKPDAAAIAEALEVQQRLSADWDAFLYAIERASDATIVLNELSSLKDDARVRIAGAARDHLSVANFRSRLHASPILRPVTIESIDASRETGFPLAFAIGARWDKFRK